MNENSARGRMNSFSRGSSARIAPIIRLGIALAAAVAIIGASLLTLHSASEGGMLPPRTHAFGLARMFQISGESKRPLLDVVRTLDEALAALGIQSTNFEALE